MIWISSNEYYFIQHLVLSKLLYFCLAQYNLTNQKITNSMEIDFIELEYRQDVLKLMEFCDLDMRQAYDLFTKSGYNFQAAVNRHLNPSSVYSEIHPVIPPEIIQPPNFNFGGMGGFEDFDDEYEGSGNNDTQYIKYKHFRTNGGLTLEKKYPPRRHEGFLMSLIPKFFKGDEESTFKSDLEKYINRKIDLKAEIGNLSQAFQKVNADKFPLAVIILSFKPELQATIKNLFSDDICVQNMLNVQYKNYGINSNTYNMQPQLKKFFNLEKQKDILVICRIDFTDQIQVVARIKLNLSVNQIKQKLKIVKSQCIQKEMEEMHMMRQYEEEKRGNLNYQRPKTIKQNIKMREDKKIRKQQQQQFFKACLPKNQEQPQQKEIGQSNNRAFIKKEEEIKKQQPKQESPQRILKRRTQLRSKLQRYESGIYFKIRVPSGHSILTKIDPNEQVQYLFDFIQSQTQDLGFNDQNTRKFDIFVGFGGSITLKGKESQKLSELFEDSETLIVRQMLD